MFTRAIVRPPAPNFAEGLTTAGLGPPDYELALAQHHAYCAALERCGLTLIRLEPDPGYPDSTFVEDVAVLIAASRGSRATPANASGRAVLARPGAPSRRDEVESLREVLSPLFPSLNEIQAPGTLDGGDVCQAGDHFFIGVSARTNEAGAHQLAEFVKQAGYTSSLLVIGRRRSEPKADRGPRSVSPRGVMDATSSLLHLKSGIAYLGDKGLAITDALEERPEFAGYDLVRVSPEEEYAANCVRVNDHVLLAAGYPKLQNELRKLNYQTIVLDVSEFRKMDGGLSCLSLRF